MKHLFYLLVLLVLVNGSSAQAQKKTKSKGENHSVLKVAGTITHQHTRVKEALVLVYCHNQVIDTIITSKRGEFTVLFEKDTNYTLLIKKEGLQDRIICLNTQLPHEKFDWITLFKFHFSVEMFKPLEDFANEDAIDFPFALVSYYKRDDGFHYHKKYTNTILKEIAHLKKEQHKLDLAKAESKEKTKTKTKPENGKIVKQDALTIQQKIDSE